MKKTFKLIATDMDGTLLKNHHEITQFTSETLIKAHEQGIQIVVATGRPFQTVKQYMSQHPYIDFFIINNGAAVYTNQNEDAVIEHAFDGETVKEILTFAATYTNDFEVHTKDAIYIHGKIRETFFKRFISKNPINPPNILPLDDFNIFSQVPATKILLIEENQEKYEMLKEAIKSFGLFEINQSQISYIDINLKGISKGHALEELTNSLNISMEDVIAFGDQENDLTMISMAGFGVAMDNATPDVKKHAQHITDSADDEGVAKAIETFVLT